MTEKIKALCEALQKNNINALYFENSLEAIGHLKNTLKRGAVISSGGSVTLNDTDILELIKGKDYNYLDRGKPGITIEEAKAVYKNILDADYYFCSANAVTKKGEIVNVDGYGNRITASIFGPEKVYIVIGTNKIVNDLNEAFLRIKTIAAPKNAVRLNCSTPCAKLGKCVSLVNCDNPGVTDGCDSPQRICRDYLIIGKQKNADRINVIIINKELGY